MWLGWGDKCVLSFYGDTSWKTTTWKTEEIEG